MRTLGAARRRRKIVAGAHAKAYEKQLSYELCNDLVRKFARGSADCRVHYSLIVKKLLSVRQSNNQKHCSLSELLRKSYSDAQSLRRLVDTFNEVTRKYLEALVEQEHYTPQIDGCVVDADLMPLLAKEYLRNPQTLNGFLSAVFERWRKILAPRPAKAK